ncbi:MAG: carboxypeptidase-like regulatory domain-containing protein [Oligoflexia bacterium]|nr:carboxypeptidase-like regulatory domain-containing protein [Oligoflexia bacterium]
MRRSSPRLIRILSLLVSFALLFSLSGCGSSSDGGGIQGTNTLERTFSGTVKDSNGQPVSGVKVELLETSDSTLTSADGTFSIMAELPSATDANIQFTSASISGMLSVQGLTENDSEIVIAVTKKNDEFVAQVISVRDEEIVSQTQYSSSAAPGLESAVPAASDANPAAGKKNKKKRYNPAYCHRDSSAPDGVVCNFPSQNESPAAPTPPPSEPSESSDTPESAGQIDLGGGSLPSGGASTPQEAGDTISVPASSDAVQEITATEEQVG